MIKEGFIKRCAQRGYTHPRDVQILMKQAINISDYLSPKQLDTLIGGAAGAGIGGLAGYGMGGGRGAALGTLGGGLGGAGLGYGYGGDIRDYFSSQKKTPATTGGQPKEEGQPRTGGQPRIEGQPRTGGQPRIEEQPRQQKKPKQQEQYKAAPRDLTNIGAQWDPSSQSDPDTLKEINDLMESTTGQERLTDGLLDKLFDEGKINIKDYNTYTKILGM